MEFLYKDELDFVPFSKFNEEEVLTELDKTIALGKERLERIKNNTDEATFENTCMELDALDGELSFLTGIFYSLNGANTNDNMQKIAREFSPKLSDFGNDISLDPVVFSRIKSVYDRRESLDLDQESMRLLCDQYDGFVRGGALLDEAKKKN